MEKSHRQKYQKLKVIPEPLLNKSISPLSSKSASREPSREISSRKCFFLQISGKSFSTFACCKFLYSAKFGPKFSLCFFHALPKSRKNLFRLRRHFSSQVSP